MPANTPSPDPSARHADLWTRFETLRGTDEWRTLDPLRTEVLTNLAELTTFARAEDYVGLHALIRRSGHEQVASIQDALDRMIGRDADQPVLTGVVWRIGDERHTRGRLVAAGHPAGAAADIAGVCFGHMFWLLLEGIERVRRVPEPRTPGELAALIRNGTVRAWRAALAPVAANPWSPYADRLADLADRAGLPVVAQSLRDCRTVYQLRREEKDRIAVGREIRRLVAISGLTQREFAAYVGTSPSRLSTYAAGKVTPSAAMLLRMQRAARMLETRAVPQASSASTSTS